MHSLTFANHKGGTYPKSSLSLQLFCMYTCTCIYMHSVAFRVSYTERQNNCSCAYIPSEATCTCTMIMQVLKDLKGKESSVGGGGLGEWVQIPLPTCRTNHIRSIDVVKVG